MRRSNAGWRRSGLAPTASNGSNNYTAHRGMAATAVPLRFVAAGERGRKVRCGKNIGEPSDAKHRS